MDKIILAIIIIALFLGVFTFVVRDYNDYHPNPDCSFEVADDGTATLPNCAKRSFEGSKLQEKLRETETPSEKKSREFLEKIKNRRW